MAHRSAPAGKGAAPRPVAPGSPAWSETAGRWALGGLLLAIALITLTPRPGSVPGSTLCVICGRRGAADALLNLAMFAPLGGLIALRRGGTVWKAALAGLALSFAIEVAQVPLPGRDASLGDVLFNAIGALLGGVGVRALARLRRRGPGLPANALGLLACATLWGGSWLLAPEIPGSRWWGQWTADTGQRIYSGRVLQAVLGDEAVAGGRELESAPAVRTELLRGEPLRLRMIAGRAPDVEAPILGIYDDARREILLFGAREQDAFFRFYTRGSALRFDRSTLRFPGAFAGNHEGDTISLALRPGGAAWGEETCLTRSDPRRSICARFTPASTWSLLMPTPGRIGRALELAWIFGLFLPAGLMMSSAGRREVGALVGLAAAGIVGATAFPAVGAPTAAEVVLVVLAAAGPAFVRRLSLSRPALR